MLKKIFLQSTNFLPNNKTTTTKNNNNKNDFFFFFCAEKNIKLFLMLKKRVIESSAWVETLRYVVLKHAAQQRFKGGVVGGAVTCFAVASLPCRRERQRERTRLKSLCMRYECEKRQTTLSVCGWVSAMCVAVNYVSIGGFRVTQFVFGTAQLERSKRKELLLFGARFNHPTTTVFLRQNNNNERWAMRDDRRASVFHTNQAASRVSRPYETSDNTMMTTVVSDKMSNQHRQENKPNLLRCGQERSVRQCAIQQEYSLHTVVWQNEQ